MRRRSPLVIQVMQPPVVALACIATSRRLRSSILVGDLHTGTFTDPKWKWASRIVLWTLRRRGFAIVPNDELADLCGKSGVDVVVSHCFVPPTPPRQAAPDDGHVLVPLAYAFDEPIDAIMGAARRLPHRRFVLTGKAPQSVRDGAPANVSFPGFVSAEEYRRLRQDAGVVLALTNQEMTMQSAGYEALADATPLVTSPRRVLRSFFGEAAIYAESDTATIADAVEEIFSQHSTWSELMARRRARQVRDQQTAVDEIKSKARAIAELHKVAR